MGMPLVSQQKPASEQELNLADLIKILPGFSIQSHLPVKNAAFHCILAF